MVGHRHMVASPRGARMARNPLTTMEYLNDLDGDAHIDLLFDQREGDGIPGAVDFNVIVRCHAGALTQVQIGRRHRARAAGAAGWAGPAWQTDQHGWHHIHA